MSVLRLLLAVALAGALTTAAAPAVENARDANAASAGHVAATDVRDAVAALVTSTPAPSGAPPAERTVDVSLPRPDAATSRVTLLVGCAPNAADTDATDVLAVRTGAGSDTAVLPVDVRVRANGTVRGDATGLRIAHRARLTLRYVRYRGVPTIVVTPGRGATVYTPARHDDAA